jgi:hypothetical protein
MILLAACKKDKSEASIMGKWTLVNFVDKGYQNGVITYNIDSPGGGTTIDFQNNGLAIKTELSGFTETWPYTIISKTKLQMNGIMYDLRDLTNSSVTLFHHEDTGPGEYFEIFLNLKR